METEIKVALIGGILGMVGTISAAIIGNHFGEKNAVQQLYSQVVTLNGNNNKVTVNNVDDFVAQYIKLLSENETLKSQNSQYFADYTEQKNLNNNLESQLDEHPVISYKNIGLCIDGEDIPINKQNAIAIIDGREYYSKELAENLLDDDQIITIKDDTLFIGKVIVEKSSLTDEVVVKSNNITITNNIKDSYGNIHTNVLYPENYHSYVTINLNRQFSLLKFRLAVQENGFSDAIVTIKADDIVVYTSPKLFITTEPFDVIDIPINYCSLLTIEIDSGSDNGFGYGFNCIISDPVVYN